MFVFEILALRFQLSLQTIKTSNQIILHFICSWKLLRLLFFPLFCIVVVVVERAYSKQVPKKSRVVYRVLRIRICYREYIKKSSFRVSYEQKTPYLNGMPFSCEPDPASPGWFFHIFQRWKCYRNDRKSGILLTCLVPARLDKPSI